MVRAVAPAAGPVPALFTALTVTLTVAPLPNPLSVTEVPVTVCGADPFALTTYPVTARPLSSAGPHVADTVPLASTVDARRLAGAPGRVYGTTVLDSGDAL